jgi:general secretion pathway protein D
VPGFGHLPVVGKIFGNNDSDGKKQELILSITPRIVRAPAISDIDTSNVYSGSESIIREKPLRLDPIGSVRGTTSGGTGAAGGAPRIDGASAGEAGSAAGGPAGARVGVPGTPGAPGAPGAGSGVGGPAGDGAAGGTPNPGAATPVAPGTVRPGATTPGTRILPPSTRPGGIFRPASPPSAPGESAPPPDPVPGGESSMLPQGQPVADAANAQKSSSPSALNTAIVAAAQAAPGVPQAAANAAAATAAAAGAAMAAAGAAKPEAGAAAAVDPSTIKAPSDASFAWSGPNSAQVGKPFQVTLNASNMLRLQRLPLVLRYDGLVLSYQSFQLGDLALKAGGSVGTPKADAAVGRLDIPITFTQPDLLTGDGPLITITFAPKTARASTSLVATQVDVKGQDGQLRTIAKPQNYVVRTVN